MRILITRFPYESATGGYGGVETQTIDLVQHWVSLGHEVTFVGSDPVLLRALTPWAKTIACPGQAIVTAARVVASSWEQFTWPPRVLKIINEQHPDLVVMLSFNEKIWLTNQLAPTTPVWWIEHERVGRWLTHNPWRKRYLAASANAEVITVSPLQAQQFHQLGIRHTHVIPNGVALPPPRPPRQFTNRHPRLGIVGRLTTEKGVDLAIKCLLHLLMEWPQTTLDIIGTGREEHNLQELVEQLNLRPHVHWLGALPPDKIAEYYLEWDVLIAPARQLDTFGLVVAEGLSYGLPVVVSHQYGISGYLTDGEDAILINPTEQDLKQGIGKAYAHRQTLSVGAQQTAQRFTKEEMYRRYDTSLLYVQNQPA